MIPYKILDRCNRYSPEDPAYLFIEAAGSPLHDVDCLARQASVLPMPIVLIKKQERDISYNSGECNNFSTGAPSSYWLLF